MSIKSHTQSVDMREITHFKPHLFRGTTELRPFNTEGLTLDHVVNLIRDHGYEVQDWDVPDLLNILTISEIIELWSPGLAGFCLDMSDMRGHSMSLQEAQNIMMRVKRIDDPIFCTCWNVVILSRHLDVLEILKYPDVPWDTYGLVCNRTVTLEHADQLNIPRVMRHHLIDRSPIHLCMDYVSLDSCCIIAKNPSLLPSHVLELCLRYPSIVSRTEQDSFSHVLSMHMHVEKIIDTISLLSEHGITLDWGHVWMNKTLTHATANRLKILLNEPFRGIYNNCSIDALRSSLMLSTLPWMPHRAITDIADILNVHPESLRMLRDSSVRRDIEQSFDSMILNTRIDLVLELRLGEEQLREVIGILLSREDITLDHIHQLMDSHNIDSMDIYIPWSRTIHIDPKDVMNSSSRLTFPAVEVFKNLKLSDLPSYPNGRVCIEEILNPSDIFNLTHIDMRGLRRNTKMKYEDYMNLITQQKISWDDVIDNWSDICRSLPFAEVVKFGLDIDMNDLIYQRGMVSMLKDMFSPEDIVYGPLKDVLHADDLIELGFPHLIDGCTKGLTMDMINTLGLDPSQCHNVSLPDICELIEPYYCNISPRSVELSERHFSGYHPRLYHLYTIGAYKTIRNCFKPMPLSERGLSKFSDMDIITV